MRVFPLVRSSGLGRSRHGKGCRDVGLQTQAQCWVWHSSPGDFSDSEVVRRERLAEKKHPALPGAWEHIAYDDQHYWPVNMSEGGECGPWREVWPYPPVSATWGSFLWRAFSSPFTQLKVQQKPQTRFREERLWTTLLWSQPRWTAIRNPSTFEHLHW